MTTIIVFGSSLFVASALVLVRALELRRGKKNILLNFISKFDSRSDKFISDLKFRSLQLIQTVRYILLVQTKISLRNLLYKIEEKIMNEYKMRQNIIMGRREIANKGSVSFYLKKITEDKGNMGRGRIEN